MQVDDRQTHAIIGAALDIHHALGGGFLEVIYQRAMHVELTARDVPHELEPRLDVVYRGHLLGSYRPDLLCFGEIIVEIKARPALESVAYAQSLHYLKAANVGCGLVLNFGARKLEWKRLLWNRVAPSADWNDRSSSQIDAPGRSKDPTGGPL